MSSNSEYAGGHVCDGCKADMDASWEITGMPGTGGNCTSCGDDLCAQCAGEWDDDGYCRDCAEEE